MEFNKLPISETIIVNNLSELNAIPMEFIENSLIVATVAHINNEYLPDNTDLSNAYFVGASLCLDIKKPDQDPIVLVLNQSTETFNIFNHETGFRRNLSIKAMKLLENLMKECNINFIPKYS